MAGPKKARGFTLVELLVVITIIGMLVSLLLPAIQSAREAGRRNTCQNNMRNAVLALLNFEQNKKGFPGYAVQIQKNVPTAGSLRRASWVVPILPYLERNDLYQNWMNPGYLIDAPTGATRQGLVSQLNVLLCPSNPSPDLGDNPLHFVVNSGSATSANDNDLTSPNTFDAMKKFKGQNWPEDPNSGVFFNQSQLDYALQPKKVSLDYISTNDGSVNTLMMTENLQAGTWGLSASGSPFPTDYAIRQNAAFVWYFTGNAANVMPPTSSFTSKYDPSGIGVNDRSKDIVGAPSGKYVDATASTPTGLAYARPSASHPGGVNAAFCDGHMRFLNDELDYKVYTQLMTPFQNGTVVDWAPTVETGAAVRANKIGVTTSGGFLGITMPWQYTLSEADF